MAADQSTPSDVPGSGPYEPGPNKYTGGGTTVHDVSPLGDRPSDLQEEAEGTA